MCIYAQSDKTWRGVFPAQFGFILFTIFSNMATNQQRYAEHDAQPSDFIKARHCRQHCLALLISLVHTLPLKVSLPRRHHAPTTTTESFYVSLRPAACPADFLRSLHGVGCWTAHTHCVTAAQVLVIYLQYNLIASKLPLNWPRGLLEFIGGIQIFFTSGEGIFSLDCLLQVHLCSLLPPKSTSVALGWLAIADTCVTTRLLVSGAWLEVAAVRGPLVL